MAVVDVGPTRFGRILEVNEAMAAMTGIERAELDGADICSFFRVTDAAEVRAQLQELVDGRSEVVRFDHPLRSDGQDETWVRLTAAPVAAEPERDACAVVQMEDVSRQRAAQARLSHLALHDSLTGLPNRSLALERVRHAQLRSQRSGAHVGVLFVDLDRFKVVNDSLGHDVGDRLLQAVASRFTSVLRPGDTVARLGGDEFLIVCEDLSADEPCAAAELRSVAGRLHGAIAEPIRLGDHVVPVTASVGLALGTGSGEGVESLVSNADTAMYEAKQQGRARSEAFDQHLRTRAVERLRTERDLRDALASDQLWMAYQPLVELASGRVAGAEALLRWDHPVRGPVPPGDFIDVAEDSGLIVEVGQLVVSEVCRDVARHPGWDGLRIAVNLSARQLSQSDFAQTVRSCLEREGLPPQRLAIELTENVLMEAGGSALRQLEELHAHGIAVGIDDFGTGYASLTYLRRLPVSFVKIDRSFVARLGRDREDASIVEAVVRLCEAMDVSVVAEGIETVEQLAVLQALGCTLGQGFLFGRPVRPDELPLADLLHTPTG
jgi:diguanylate cyclase (GGDEF)-like protein/PAS domain S-box-containing protein